MEFADLVQIDTFLLETVAFSMVVVEVFFRERAVSIEGWFVRNTKWMSRAYVAAVLLLLALPVLLMLDHQDHPAFDLIIHVGFLVTLPIGVVSLAIRFLRNRMWLGTALGLALCGLAGEAWQVSQIFAR